MLRSGRLLHNAIVHPRRGDLLDAVHDHHVDGPRDGRPVRCNPPSHRRAALTRDTPAAACSAVAAVAALSCRHIQNRIRTVIRMERQFVPS